MNRAGDEAIERLCDYTSGHGTPDEEAAFEEDLFARALEGAAPELEDVDAIRRGLRDLARRGTVTPFIGPDDADRIRGSGLRVHSIEISRDTRSMTIPRDTEILIVRLALDLRGVTRLELEEVSESGIRVVNSDIPFDPAGACIVCCEADLARASAGTTGLGRMWSLEESGRRLLAEYSIRTELED